MPSRPLHLIYNYFILSDTAARKKVTLQLVPTDNTALLEGVVNMKYDYTSLVFSAELANIYAMLRKDPKGMSVCYL